jgi:hypothetical protein
LNHRIWEFHNADLENGECTTPKGLATVGFEIAFGGGISHQLAVRCLAVRAHNVAGGQPIQIL